MCRASLTAEQKFVGFESGESASDNPVLADACEEEVLAVYEDNARRASLDAHEAAR